MADIESMTLGQIREVAALIGVVPQKPPRTVEKKRVILVVDRGWIFAGDQSITADGYIRLTNAVHVFKFESIGFSRVITEWRSEKVDLRKIDDVEIPTDAVVFRVPVPDGWGIK